MPETTGKDYPLYKRGNEEVRSRRITFVLSHDEMEEIANIFYYVDNCLPKNKAGKSPVLGTLAMKAFRRELFERMVDNCILLEVKQEKEENDT